MNESNNPYSSPEAKLPHPTPADTEYKGLSGWLVLVAIGIVLSPLKLLADIFLVFKPIFEDGSWEMLTTEGAEAYHPMWSSLLIGEFVYNVLLLLGFIYLVYLFFSKHYLFPKFYIGIALVSFIFIPTDAWLVTKILPNEPMFDEAGLKEMVGAAIKAAIWIPYMLVSKRVKATFVEKRPNRV